MAQADERVEALEAQVRLLTTVIAAAGAALAQLAEVDRGDMSEVMAQTLTAIGRGLMQLHEPDPEPASQLPLMQAAG